MRACRLKLNFRCLALAFLAATSGAANAAQISFTDHWTVSRSFSSGFNVRSATDYLTDDQSLRMIPFASGLGTLQRIDILLDQMSMTSSASADFVDADRFSQTEGEQTLGSMSLGVNVFDGADYYRGTAETRMDSCSGMGILDGATCSTELRSLSVLLPDASFQYVVAQDAAGSFINPIDFNISLFGILHTAEINGDDGTIDWRDGSISARGRVTVTYNYAVAAVPEPSQVSLMVAGLVGLFALRARRQSLAR